MRRIEAAFLALGIAAWLPVASVAAPDAKAGADVKPDADAAKAAAEAEKEAKKQHEEAVKKCLDDFKKALREGKTENERAAAVRELGECGEKDPKIVAAVARFLGDPSELVRKEAASALGNFHKDKMAVQALSGAIDANKKSPGTLERIFSALGKTGDPGALPVLVDHLHDNNVTSASGAAKGLGELGMAGAIEPLIKLLERLEKDSKYASDTNIPGKGSAGGNEANKDLQERYNTLRPAIKDALRSITGEEWRDSKDYADWWAKNRTTFKGKGDEDPKDKEKMNTRKGA